MAESRPIAIFTNAVRMTTIWFLATGVNMGFMDATSTKKGGAFFSLISLAILLLFVCGLRRLERAGPRGESGAGVFDTNAPRCGNI